MFICRVFACALEELKLPYGTNNASVACHANTTTPTSKWNKFKCFLLTELSKEKMVCYVLHKLLQNIPKLIQQSVFEY